MVAGIKDISDKMRELTGQALMATSGEKEKKPASTVSRQVDSGKQNIMRIKESIFFMLVGASLL